MTLSVARWRMVHLGGLASPILTAEGITYLSRKNNTQTLSKLTKMLVNIYSGSEEGVNSGDPWEQVCVHINNEH